LGYIFLCDGACTLADETLGDGSKTALIADICQPIVISASRMMAGILVGG